jgi:FAD synthetase
VSLEKLVSKYIDSATHVFETMHIAEGQTGLNKSNVEKVVESARAYLGDAEYFRNDRKFEVSLTSVAYCEGLLDALRLLGAVTFEWPSKEEAKREE